MSEHYQELLKKRSPWANNNNTVWLASNVALRRNIEKFRFPGKLGMEKRNQLVKLLGNELSSSSLLKNPYLLKAEEIDPIEKEFLAEHLLSTESFQGAHQGEGFVIDDTGAFLCSLNIKDHIHFQEVDITSDPESAWKRLVKLETSIGNKLPYAYSSQFGFLTADPIESGTGFHTSIFLQLSALIHTGELEEELKKIEDPQIAMPNFLGHANPFVGDVLVLTNAFTLGFNEETILASVRGWATSFIKRENEARARILSEESADVKDKVARAWAVLIHSYQIEPQEALDAIALVKLGCDLKWIKGIKISALNELFFNCRRGHLLGQFKETPTPEETLHKRAEFIHKSLKGTELLI